MGVPTDSVDTLQWRGGQTPSTLGAPINRWRPLQELQRMGQTTQAISVRRFGGTMVGRAKERFAHACSGRDSDDGQPPSTLARANVILPQIGQLTLQAFEVEAQGATVGKQQERQAAGCFAGTELDANQI